MSERDVRNTVCLKMNFMSDGYSVYHLKMWSQRLKHKLGLKDKLVLNTLA